MDTGRQRNISWIYKTFYGHRLGPAPTTREEWRQVLGWKETTVLSFKSDAEIISSISIIMECFPESTILKELQKLVRLKCISLQMMRRGVELTCPEKLST